MNKFFTKIALGFGVLVIIGLAGTKALGLGGFTFDALNAPLPEPARMLLLGTGLVGIAATLRRARKKSK